MVSTIDTFETKPAPHLPLVVDFGDGRTTGPLRGCLEISRKGFSLVGGDDGKQRKFVAPHQEAVLGQELKGHCGDGEKGEMQVKHGWLLRWIVTLFGGSC